MFTYHVLRAVARAARSAQVALHRASFAVQEAAFHSGEKAREHGFKSLVKREARAAEAVLDARASIERMEDRHDILMDIYEDVCAETCDTRARIAAEVL